MTIRDPRWSLRMLRVVGTYSHVPSLDLLRACVWTLGRLFDMRRFLFVFCRIVVL